MSLMNVKNITFLIALTLGGQTHAQIPGSASDKNTLEGLPPISFTENPCPDPRQALSETPNDLKIIQEDITRFTLCLQRAQLLSRLNDLAVDSVETINSSLDEKLEEIASSFASAPMSAMEMQPMPSIGNSANDELMPMQAAPEPEPVFEHPDWTINTIKGIGGVLIANISDIDGNVVNVKSGDKIEDTEIRITAVTQTSVKIREDSESTKLKWSQ